jgi:hypothetical protein
MYEQGARRNVDCSASVDIKLATDKLRERIVQLRGRMPLCLLRRSIVRPPKEGLKNT